MIAENWQSRVGALVRDTYALYLACRDPRVPTLAKVVIGVVVAYALSPIDLVPDFIPVLGLVDDLLLLPLGVWLAVRLVPPDVWRACRARAADRTEELPVNRRAAIVIILLWVAGAAALLNGLYSHWH